MSWVEGNQVNPRRALEIAPSVFMQKPVQKTCGPGAPVAGLPITRYNGYNNIVYIIRAKFYGVSQTACFEIFVRSI